MWGCRSPPRTLNPRPLGGSRSAENDGFVALSVALFVIIGLDPLISGDLRFLV